MRRPIPPLLPVCLWLLFVSATAFARAGGGGNYDGPSSSPSSSPSPTPDPPSSSPPSDPFPTSPPSDPFPAPAPSSADPSEPYEPSSGSAGSEDRLAAGFCCLLACGFPALIVLMFSAQVLGTLSPRTLFKVGTRVTLIRDGAWLSVAFWPFKVNMFGASERIIYLAPGKRRLAVVPFMKAPLPGVVIDVPVGKLRLRANENGTILIDTNPAPPAPHAVITSIVQTRGSSVDRLLAADPAFSMPAFQQAGAELFLAVQAAWSAGDMGPVRARISDGVYNRFSTLLELDRLRGQRNSLSEAKVQACSLISARVTPPFQAIDLRIHARGHDQTVEIGPRGEAGRVISETTEPFSEIWTFLRRIGVGTPDIPPGIGACPSCGATMDVGEANRCKHCTVLVNSGAHGWVLAEITQSTAPPEPSALQPGAALLAADPTFSVASVEDRASVIFWALIEAAYTRKPQSLRRLASSAWLAGFRSEYGPQFVDVGVGSVTTISAQLSGPRVIAVVEVDWTGTGAGGISPDAGRRVKGKSVLMLGREAGSPVDRGLASAGCGSCGGPLERSDQDACRWCGAAIVAVPTDWVLEEGSVRG